LGDLTLLMNSSLPEVRMDFRVSFVGLLVGFLVGLTGAGGGSLLAPLLILFFGVQPVWAVGTDMAYSTVTKAIGSVVHIRQKQVDFTAVLWLAIGGIPAILLSVGLVQFLRLHAANLINSVIIHAIGYTLLLVAVLLVTKPWLMNWLTRRNEKARKERLLAGEGTPEERQPRATQPYLRVAMILVGAVVGFLVGLTSIGSGSLILVALTFLAPRLTPKELVGTNIFQAFFLVAVGALAYATAGAINWTLVGLLLLGSVPGVLLGSRLTKYVPDPLMRPLLAVVLVITGWKLI
jgi:uncharacterized membrane protein YfcA